VKLTAKQRVEKIIRPKIRREGLQARGRKAYGISSIPNATP
jgi:hypothetical protein